MSAAGSFRIAARWQQGRLSGLRLDATRPRAATLLQGQSPALVQQLVPRIFSLCAHAQQAAAWLALGMAGGGAPDEARCADLARQVAAEALRESLWRVLLDWPPLLGLPPRHDVFAPLYQRLAAVTDAASGAAVADEVLTLLGLEADGTLKPGAYAQQLLAALAAREAAWFAPVSGLARPLLPSQGASAWCACLGGVPTSEQCLAPVLAGQPHEAGALARQGAHPAVQHWLTRGQRLCARLQARFLDMAEECSKMQQNPVGTGLSAASPAYAEGLAVVETARGPLIHGVRLARGVVEAYGVLAPTEWNFHPQGVFVLEAGNVAAHNESDARSALQALALSLDPCVGFTVELNNPQGALHA